MMMDRLIDRDRAHSLAARATLTPRSSNRSINHVYLNLSIHPSICDSSTRATLSPSI